MAVGQVHLHQGTTLVLWARWQPPLSCCAALAGARHQQKRGKTKKVVQTEHILHSVCGEHRATVQASDRTADHLRHPCRFIVN